MNIDKMFVLDNHSYIYMRFDDTTLKKYRSNCLEENVHYIEVLSEFLNKYNLLLDEKIYNCFNSYIVVLYQRVISNYYRFDAPKEVDKSELKKVCISLNCYFKNQRPIINNLPKKRQVVYYLMKYKCINILNSIYKRK